MVDPIIHIDEQGRRVRVGVILWTLDPEQKIRYFLRHNRPFDGHRDEWNMIFGSVEPGEAPITAAVRETKEEADVTTSRSQATDLEYTLEYTPRNGPTIIRFFGIKLNSLDTPIRLNEESIGYDWLTIDDVALKVPYPEQLKAFEMIEKAARQ